MATEVAATAAKTFKGVMLCERPANGDMKIADGGAKYRPFLPTSSSAANEQLGLTPAYKELPKRVKRTDDAMSKHRRWLADEQYRLRSNRESDALEEEERLQRIKQHAEFTAGLRATILSNKPSSHLFGQLKKPDFDDVDKSTSAIQNPNTNPSIAMTDTNFNDTAADTSKKGEEENIDEDLMSFIAEAITVAKQKDALADQNKSKVDVVKEKSVVSGSESTSVIPAASRPKWAQTETEAAALENTEADELIEFAAGLDIEKYLEEFGKEEESGVLSIIDEAEKVKKELDEKALVNSDELEWKKRFVRAVNHITNKELLERNACARDDNDDDTFSIAGGSIAGGKVLSNASGASKLKALKIEKANDEAKWDSSTIVDSEAYQGGITKKADTGKRAVAEDILRENPQLRSVHSMASVQAMISDSSKAQENE